MAENLLYLVHRIPFPPNKGDKIRSHHLLEHLSKRYRVHLGAFVDDEEDWKHVEKIRTYCRECCLLKLDPRIARLRSLTGLLTGEALSLPYYSSAKLQDWVDGVVREYGIRKAVAFSSAMGQYLERHRDMLRIMDFVDVDSDKWTQYADSGPFPLRLIYRREGRRLAQYERRLAREFDASFFVSPQEARLFRTIAPESSGKIHAYQNGVDSEYFSPERAYPDPYPAGEKAIVFTGAMDYWPNIDAVGWFAREVFPSISGSGIRFYIVGSNPAEPVRRLADRPGIVVTGRVEDVRPYLAHAALAVAPLRIARGIQNKVLEALAMGKTVVASPQAMEGIPEHAACRICESAAQFSATLGVLLASGEAGPGGRQFILDHYNWERNLHALSSVLERTS